MTNKLDLPTHLTALKCRTTSVDRIKKEAFFKPFDFQVTSILTSSTSPPETQRSRDNHPVFIKRFNFENCFQMIISNPPPGLLPAHIFPSLRASLSPPPREFSPAQSSPAKRLPVVLPAPLSWLLPAPNWLLPASRRP